MPFCSCIPTGIFCVDDSVVKGCSFSNRGHTSMVHSLQRNQHIARALILVFFSEHTVHQLSLELLTRNLFPCLLSLVNDAPACYWLQSLDVSGPRLKSLCKEPVTTYLLMSRMYPCMNPTTIYMLNNDVFLCLFTWMWHISICYKGEGLCVNYTGINTHFYY